MEVLAVTGSSENSLEVSLAPRIQNSAMQESRKDASW